jgi:endo-1,4-beta-xylanase
MVLGAGLALAACDRQARSQPALDIAPFKLTAPYRVGSCVQASHLDDPAWIALTTRHCSQLTPEWEMKMEYVVQPDGALQFDRGDRIAAFCRDAAIRLYGTTLVWYAQKPAWFEGLEPARFGKAYDDYIATIVGRYRGQAAGWDVVNEAVAEDGAGWRRSLWAERLGDFDHMRRAFDTAHAADPGAVLFLNDYNLESIPKKLDEFQRLAERLLKAGAPVSGLGCQSHLNADLATGAYPRTLQALARFGLPIHVSELDISLSRVEDARMARPARQAAQAKLYEEAADAFSALPDAQRFAFTFWGLRDADSWLRREDASDAPAPFDDFGQAKPAAAAAARGFANGFYGNSKRRG